MTGAARAQRASEAARITGQLTGAYKLVWFDTYGRDGKVTRSPFTVGRISYGAAGRMSAQLMRPDRPRFAGPQATDAERAAAYSGYVSYFGRYEVDADRRTVTHHVEGALGPNMVGQPLVRHFEFSPDGSTLFLSVSDGDRVTGRLQWDRCR
jgi:hypothetical protein